VNYLGFVDHTEKQKEGESLTEIEIINKRTLHIYTSNNNIDKENTNFI
jgi:hypothetical protein